MPLCWFSLLFLAWLFASQAQQKRQRVGELESALRGMQGSACFRGGAQGGPFVALPWALLLALLGSLIICLLLAKKLRTVTAQAWPLAPIVSWLKGRSLFGDTPEAEDADTDPDARLEEMLLRDVSGVLQVIRLRLWRIVRDRQKHRKLLHKRH